MEQNVINMIDLYSNLFKKNMIIYENLIKHQIVFSRSLLDFYQSFLIKGN